MIDKIQKIEIVNVGALRRVTDFFIWVFIGWVILGVLNMREPSTDPRVEEYCKKAIDSELCKQL